MKAQKKKAKKANKKYQMLKEELERTLTTVEYLKAERETLMRKPKTNSIGILTDPMPEPPEEPPTLRSSLFAGAENENTMCEGTQTSIHDELEESNLTFESSTLTNEVPFIETPDLAMAGISTER